MADIDIDQSQCRHTQSFTRQYTSKHARVQITVKSIYV